RSLGLSTTEHRISRDDNRRNSIHPVASVKRPATPSIPRTGVGHTRPRTSNVVPTVIRRSSAFQDLWNSIESVASSRGTHFRVSASTELFAARVVSFFDSLSASGRSEEHTSELQSRENLVCRLLLEKKKTLKLDKIILSSVNKDT